MLSSLLGVIAIPLLKARVLVSLFSAFALPGLVEVLNHLRRIYVVLRYPLVVFRRPSYLLNEVVKLPSNCSLISDFFDFVLVWVLFEFR